MLFDEVCEIIADQLEINPEDIQSDSLLIDDLGAEAFDAIDIAMTIEEQYSIEVPDEAIREMASVQDIVSFIESNLD
ncbi:MAG: acyl carrier protein [Eubacterium sp.]|nr:acyl carrier protein [Eubacterium sp.]MBR4240826.1 acyl carrier protein [Eubacterium sp.]MBR7060605.1 acyl carrier protein [Eubacterium sp.]